MIKNVRKVGDSLGVLLPTREIREVFGIDEGSPVQVIIESGSIKIVPLDRKPDIEAVQKITNSLISRYGKTLQILTDR